MSDDEATALARAGPTLPLAGEWTLGALLRPPRRRSTSGRAAGVGRLRALWRNWAFESAALDLALRQAGRPLHEVLGREPRPLRFVNSLGLGEPPSTDTDPPPARPPSRRCASSSTPPRPGRSRSARTSPPPARSRSSTSRASTGWRSRTSEALARHVRARGRDVPGRDPRGPARPARGRRARSRRTPTASPTTRRSPGRRPRHDAGQPDPRRQHQAVPHRRACARCSRSTRAARRDGLLMYGGGMGELGVGARADPAARVDLPPRRAERRGAERVQRRPDPPEGLPTSPLPPALHGWATGNSPAGSRSRAARRSAG